MKQSIARLALDGFKFVAVETPAAEQREGSDLFLHSTFLVLVDQRGAARGIYYFSDPRFKKQLLQDLNRLLRES